MLALARHSRDGNVDARFAGVTRAALAAAIIVNSGLQVLQDEPPHTAHCTAAVSGDAVFDRPPSSRACFL